SKAQLDPEAAQTPDQDLAGAQGRRQRQEESSNRGRVDTGPILLRSHPALSRFAGRPTTARDALQWPGCGRIGSENDRGGNEREADNTGAMGRNVSGATAAWSVSIGDRW